MRAMVTSTGIGGVATLLYIVISALLARGGVTPWIASAVCYAAFVPIVYLAQKNWAFQSTRPHSQSLPRYVMSQGIGLSLSAALPYALAGRTSYLVSFIAVAIVVAIVNFLLLKWWTFQ